LFLEQLCNHDLANSQPNKSFSSVLQLQRAATVERLPIFRENRHTRGEDMNHTNKIILTAAGQALLKKAIKKFLPACVQSAQSHHGKGVFFVVEKGALLLTCFCPVLF
jgi:hypothetical protein